LDRPVYLNLREIDQIKKGNQTQLLRLVKSEDVACLDFLAGRCDNEPITSKSLGQQWRPEGLMVWCAEYPDEGVEFIEPYFGQPGDILWVKESYADGIGIGGCIDGDITKPINVIYRVDGARGIKWFSSCAMPKRYARIRLNVMWVSIIKVKELSFEDLLAQGYTESPSVRAWDSFVVEWDDMHPKYPYETNPWVWKYTFEKSRGTVKDEQQVRSIGQDAVSS